MASPQYITPAELYDAFDRRLIEKLSGDGQSGPIDSNNTKIITSIERASERIQMAATVGNRYTTDELDTMQTDDRWALKELAAQLTVGILAGRRGAGIDESIQQQMDHAEKVLERLENGDMVFPVAVNRQAGKAEISVMQPATRGLINLVGDTDFFPDSPIRAY